MLPSLFEPSSPPPSPDNMEDIGRAFFAALDRDGGPWFSVGAIVVASALLVFLVRWVSRESKRERRQQALLDARHETVMRETAARRDQREWVRVRTQVPITLRHTTGPSRFTHERSETQNLSGRGVAFHSHRPPPPGAPLRVTLHLGEKKPLVLRGVVVRVEAPPSVGGPSLVALRFGPMTMGEHDHVIRWVTHEQAREIVRARRGRLCTFCRRPLADAMGEMHPSCSQSGPATASRATTSLDTKTG